MAADVYDLLGFVTSVGAPAGEAQTAVRAVLQGFGPVQRAAGITRTHFELTAGPANEWQVRVDGETVETSDNLKDALGQLEWRLVTSALEHRSDLFHLHASALCAPRSRDGVLLLGGSGRGKTTLTMGLMLRGFVPSADDVTLIDPETLELRAFRRAFHVADDTWALLEGLVAPFASQRHEMPGYFSPAQWADHHARVRWVLLPEYRPDQTPELVPLSASELASAMISQTLSLERTPRMALSTAARLTDRARGYRFLCGDLEQSVAMVQGLIAASAAEPGESRG